MVAAFDIRFYSDSISQLYDPKTRQEMLASGLRSLPTVAKGIEKYLGDIDRVSKLSTVSGMVEQACETGESRFPSLYGKGAELYEKLPDKAAVAERLEKAKCSEGRRELIEEGKEAVAPYVEKGKEAVAPYMQKIVAKKDEVLSDKRVAAALSGLKNAKEHPRETAAELRKAAVDLISYETLAGYREYVQSDNFQEDTLRLIKEDLPAVAGAAAAKGITAVHDGATTLACELSKSRAALVATLRAKLSEKKMVDPEQFDVQVSKLAELSARITAFASDAAAFVPDGAWDAIKRLSQAVGIETEKPDGEKPTDAAADAEAKPEADAEAEPAAPPPAAEPAAAPAATSLSPHAAEFVPAATAELEGDTDGF